ncbi:hypothetical protein BC628DRAFT_1502638 [Trametes gibbosa]|nr:hypothetical protein BC628DRAFT_1502638 [Trametes gibbosa]
MNPTVHELAFCSERAPTLPEEDLHALKFVPPSDIQQWALDRGKVYESRLRAIHMLYNAAAPINERLPPEILSHIFASVAPDTPGEIRLLHISFPSQQRGGSRISSKEPSASRRLKVQSASPELCTTTWMRPHLARISDLDLSVNVSRLGQLLPLLYNGSFASMTRLSLVWIPYATSIAPSPPDDDETFEGQCPDSSLPHLKHMSLSTIFLESGLVVASIEHIGTLATPFHKIGRGSTDALASPHAFFHCLKRCFGRLASLYVEIDQSIADEVAWIMPSEYPDVDLPSLRKLAIVSYEASVVTTFLTSTRISPSTLVNIHCRHSTPILYHCLPQHYSVVAPEQLTISFTRSHVNLAVSYAGKDIMRIRTQGTAVDKYLCLLFSHPDSLRALTLSSENYNIWFKSVPGILAALPNLSRLAIHNPPHGTAPNGRRTSRSLLERLALHSEKPSLIRTLDELVIYHYDPSSLLSFRDNLVALLEHRLASAGRPLRSLTLAVVPFRINGSPVGDESDAELVARAHSIVSERLGTLVDEISVVPYRRADMDVEWMPCVHGALGDDW